MFKLDPIQDSVTYLKTWFLAEKYILNMNIIKYCRQFVLVMMQSCGKASLGWDGWEHRNMEISECLPLEPLLQTRQKTGIKEWKEQFVLHHNSG